MKRKSLRFVLFCLISILLLTGCIVGPESKVEKATILTAVLISPEKGAEINENSPKFEWFAINGVTEYTFEIKKISDNSVVAKGRYDSEKRCDTAICSIPSPVEFAPGDYKWHVVGWVGEIRGEFSNYFTLTIH